jgi:hypothetical protein
LVNLRALGSCVPAGPVLALLSHAHDAESLQLRAVEISILVRVQPVEFRLHTIHEFLFGEILPSEPEPWRKRCTRGVGAGRGTGSPRWQPASRTGEGSLDRKYRCQGCTSPTSSHIIRKTAARGEIMPTEFYLGAVAVVILIALLASLFRGSMVPRRRVSHNGSDTGQLVRQLSRIADALEKLTGQSGASPARVEEPSALPSQKSPEKTPPPASAEPQAQTAEPAKPHVSLSMFGR